LIERGSRNVPSRVEGLHFGRRTVAEALVEAVVVEPADVFHDGQLELRPGLPDAVCDELGLEAVDERFGQRVVVGVADPTLASTPWSVSVWV
jgi:hypothetical protein